MNPETERLVAWFAAHKQDFPWRRGQREFYEVRTRNQWATVEPTQVGHQEAVLFIVEGSEGHSAVPVAAVQRLLREGA